MNEQDRFVWMNGSGYVAFLFLYQIGNMTFSLALSNIFFAFANPPVFFF